LKPQNHSDVIIIGGGAIGVCTAYYLWKNGVQVALLEKGEICSGCSYGNAGLIVPSHIIPLAAPGMIAKGLKWMFNPESPFYLKPRLELDFLEWLWKFNRASTSKHVRIAIPVLHALLQASSVLFDEIAQARHFDFSLEKKGLLQLYKSHHEFDAERAVAEQARQIGLQVSELNPEALHALLPGLRTRAVGGLYYHHDAHLEPAKFVRNLSNYLLQQGVAIYTNTEVYKLVPAGNRITTVETSEGIMTAREFILAGGAWSAQLLRALQIKLPLQGGKGYSITLAAGEPKLDVPCMLHEARVGITPMNGKIRFAGTMELAGLDLSISPRRVAAILKAVPEYIVDWHPLTQLNAAEVWSGLRPCTPDGLPYIGRFARYSNIIAATGHAMLGITLAPITGQLVAEIIGGKTPRVALAPLRCERFN